MKKIALLALVCAFAEAQTIVQQRLVDASGKLQTSVQFNISWPNFTTVSGIAVSAGTMTRTITNGQLTIPLYPTIGANPPSAVYTVHVTTGTITSDELWAVPVSATAVTRNNVIVQQAPSGTGYTPSSIDVSQITQGIAASGQAIFWNDTIKSWQPQPVSYTVTGTWLSYSTGSVSATRGAPTVTGAGTSWTSDMAGRWLMLSGTTKQYKVRTVDVTNQTLTTYDNFDVDISAGSSYSLTQPILVTAVTHGLNSANIDATCKNSNGATNADVMVGTLVDASKNVEVVLYGAFTGSCTLRR